MAEYLDINGAKTLLTGVKNYINNNAGGGLAFDLTQFKPAEVNFSDTESETITVDDDVNFIDLCSTSSSITSKIERKLVIPKNKEVLISIDCIYFSNNNAATLSINNINMLSFLKYFSNGKTSIADFIFTALHNGTNLIVNVLGQYKSVTTADSKSYMSYVPINMIYVF